GPAENLPGIPEKPPDQEAGRELTLRKGAEARKPAEKGLGTQPVKLNPKAPEFQSKGAEQSKLGKKQEKRPVKVSFKEAGGCPLKGCPDGKKHQVSECWIYQMMSWARRMKATLDHQLCTLCLAEDHMSLVCSLAKATASPCKNGCVEKHHTSLCWGTQTEGRKPASGKLTVDKRPRNRKAKKPPGRPAEAAHRPASPMAKVNALGGGWPVRMLSQRIEVQGGHECVAMWDSGSQATLVTDEFADRAQLEAVETQGLSLVGLGEVTGETTKRAFKVPLITSQGEVREVTAHALSYITTPLEAVDLSEVMHKFPEVTPEDVPDEEGPVDMLLGLDAACMFPEKVRSEGGAALYSSEFGTNWMLVGTQHDVEDGFNQVMEDRRTEAKTRTMAAQAAMLPAKQGEPGWKGKEFFVPSNFIAAEAMGTEVPRRCPSCRGCKECEFKMNALTFKESKELEVITDGLVLDKERRKWTAAYPFCEPPSLLIDNYKQALRIT
ncbi:MAG: hypothetical protein AN484_26035, partial [Aphanizomenon flos-aquae WA102]